MTQHRGAIPVYVCVLVPQIVKITTLQNVKQINLPPSHSL